MTGLIWFVSSSTLRLRLHLSTVHMSLPLPVSMPGTVSTSPPQCWLPLRPHCHKEDTAVLWSGSSSHPTMGIGQVLDYCITIIYFHKLLLSSSHPGSYMKRWLQFFSLQLCYLPGQFSGPGYYSECYIDYSLANPTWQRKSIAIVISAIFFWYYASTSQGRLAVSRGLDFESWEDGAPKRGR